MIELSQRLKWRERPDDKPVMFQRWQRLLFLHWTFSSEEIQPLLPPGLTVDTFNGVAYVGVVPFEMRNIHPWWFPSVPYISNFLELNVRTYVIDEFGRPGVYFISLNADRWIACAFGRSWFHLPYHWCKMNSRIVEDGVTDYRCQRRTSESNAESHLQFRKTGSPSPAEPGTLEFFLVERYLLFTMRSGELCYGQVHHTPYPLQSAEVLKCDNAMLRLDGVPERPQPPEHIGYVEGVDVDVFALKRVRQ